MQKICWCLMKGFTVFRKDSSTKFGAEPDIDMFLLYKIFQLFYIDLIYSMILMYLLMLKYLRNENSRGVL